MKKLICPLTLGDEIWLSGAVIELARIHGELQVPAYSQYMESVRSFYVNHPEITVYEVPNPPGSNWGSPPVEAYKVVGEPLVCGDHGPKVEWSKLSHPEWHYKQLGIDFSHRWDSCPLQRAWEKTGPQVLKTPEYFLHEDAERGYVIARNDSAKGNIPSHVFTPSAASGSILRYAYALAQAQYIHVIDSSFFHLAESIDTFGFLYLHLYPRGITEKTFAGEIRTIRHPYPTRKKWNVIT